VTTFYAFKFFTFGGGIPGFGNLLDISIAGSTNVDFLDIGDGAGGLLEIT
jgi:hypothetical protein